MESIKEEKKQTSGRQKIDIKKIEDNAKLQVTFSKRKGGLFRKASELSIVCGVDVAIIVFSPAGKAFACGHPTPDHIVDRFLNNGEASARLPKIHEGDELSLCQQRDKEIQKELEAEKEKRGRFLEMLMNCNLDSGDASSWDTYVDGLSLAELEQMRSDMEQLMKIVEKRCEERMGTDVDSFSWLMTVPDSEVNAVDADFVLDGKLSNAASSSPSPMIAPDSDAYTVAHADNSFDFNLDGKLSNYVASSSSSSMTTPDSDVNAVAADDSSNFVLDVNPITVDDPFEFLNIDVPDLLEIEWC
ncbi:hypothetical protein MKW98_012004 [Papaver atlanticum]|uniref:MADS-box domain-containing protein n=1 Tax=Papaver atlanticum TaxID=357466 RepID=A0AAD4XFI6_9MAGN|nr:hypothetical protein MKW98_012004 [Papaver atlanticum]